MRRKGGHTRHEQSRPEPPIAHLLMAFRAPAEQLLTLALRRVAHSRPDVFERLGPHSEDIFHLAPAESPLAFQLRPSATRGMVRLKHKADTAGSTATIEGPLWDLLDVFDGSLDADSAFFARRIVVQGRTDAVVALHNTLEAADLNIADLVGGGRAGAAAAHAASGLRKLAHAWSRGRGARP